MISSVIFALAILFVVWILKRLLLLWRLPPGPWGLPLLGSGFKLDIGNLPQLLIKWHGNYGDIFSFSLPVHQDVIVVSSDELIQEVLIKRSSEFSNKPWPDNIRRYGLFDGNIDVPFSNDTPQWRVMKKALTVSLKMYGERLLVLEDIATSAVQDMVGKWRKQSGKIINPKGDIADVVYEIISSLVFHRAFSPDEAETWADISVKFLYGLMERAQYLDFFPWLRYFPNADWKFLKDVHKEIVSFINGQIKQRMEHFDGINPQCTLDALILYQRKHNNEKEDVITDTNITYMAFDLMWAGLTTTLQMTCCMLAILADPDHANIVKKLREEIDTNIGKGIPRLADRQKLPFVEAFILESFRYWTQSCILNPHAANMDTTLAGFPVPKGAWVWPNVLNLAHDERYWKNPWKFNPDNFLDRNGEVVPSDHLNRKRLLSFGAGRRVCIGEVLGKSRLFLLITSILQNFEISPAPGKKKPNHDCRGNFVGGLISRPEDYEILICSRSG